jgi:hypothetical protein
MASVNQMVILYPGISIIKEVYCSFKILIISPFCFGVDDVKPNRVRGRKQYGERWHSTTNDVKKHGLDGGKKELSW